MNLCIYMVSNWLPSFVCLFVLGAKKECVKACWVKKKNIYKQIANKNVNNV